MKNINEMTLDELTELAVTMDAWEWMKGVMDTDGDIVLGNGQLCCLLDGDSGGYVCEAPDRVRPDLEDPATTGCVMAMVRKKYGPNTWTVYTPRGWQVMTWEPVESIESYMAIIQTAWGEDTIALGKMGDDEFVVDPGTGEPLGRFAEVAIKLKTPNARVNCIVSASEEMPTEIHALIAALAKEKV